MLKRLLSFLHCASWYGSLFPLAFSARSDLGRLRGMCGSCFCAVFGLMLNAANRQPAALTRSLKFPVPCHKVMQYSRRKNNQSGCSCERGGDQKCQNNRSWRDEVKFKGSTRIHLGDSSGLQYWILLTYCSSQRAWDFGANQRDDDQASFLELKYINCAGLSFLSARSPDMSGCRCALVCPARRGAVALGWGWLVGTGSIHPTFSFVHPS
ncbi:hypothetical protein CCUS01_11799 [Colletotrichum cuscutae]|uniref:Uncharacterized protein n=1 Tax=Colletotrichum cuscutae TaxID=1209917 RepID=A0AAI9TYB3_9PEZI|nr:hypothetical protein CCUS01_11799 [Colletotrichum cuscutae]